MRLSILVCSTQNRYNNFLLNILKQLFDQCKALPLHLSSEVEVITVIDNKTRMLGTKRNDMLNMAQGDYVVFVDDDDRVSDDYVQQLLDSVSVGADIITFEVEVSLNGKEPKPCYYDMRYKADYNLPDSYHRLPNHIMAVKRELALATKYQDILKGEDADYSKRLAPLLKTQHIIEKVLYYYDYSDVTTETQQKLKRR
jgi:glycosyltransferase involved in cell wall biosynthesis